ncbi:MAG: NAD-dependent epimerase/dehydratase family protein [Deltaproteobacteria bacterium]|nr:NAD-dependent epimerase/dehydratase family protein [Deltaproteobacteria bacterium]
MKFLITGADGLLGNNLVRELLDERNGHAVRVLLQPLAEGGSLSELNVEKVHADIISDVAILDESMKGCDGVFHCAAITDLLASHEAVDLVNVTGTRNIIESCLKNRVKRLVFVGSASSFQFGTRHCPGDETGGFSPTYKGMSYMESKHAAMKLVLG